MATKKALKKKIEELETRIQHLENMHARSYAAKKAPIPVFHLGPLWTDLKRENVYFYGARQLTACEYEKDRARHPAPEAINYDTIYNIPKLTVDTKTISNISFKELARYVIDGTPIKRKEEDKVVYTATYSPDSKINSVSTKLGGISIVEKHFRN